MGKRRIRCLQALQYSDILGVDPRQDRREESENLYSITTTDSISNVNFDEIDAIVISTPPDQHIQYQLLAIDNGKPAFVEASILIHHVEKVLRYNTNNVFIGPSCTLCFHPLIKAIKKFANTGEYGKITNFVYNSGQYLPDFHGLVVDAIDALETSPVKLEVTGDTGKDECFLTALDFSWAVAGMIGRRFSMQYIVEDFAPLARSDFSGWASSFPSSRAAPRRSAMR